MRKGAIHYSTRYGILHSKAMCVENGCAREELSQTRTNQIVRVCQKEWCGMYGTVHIMNCWEHRPSPNKSLDPAENRPAPCTSPQHPNSMKFRNGSWALTVRLNIRLDNFYSILSLFQSFFRKTCSGHLHPEGYTVRYFPRTRRVTD